MSGPPGTGEVAQLSRILTALMGGLGSQHLCWGAFNTHSSGSEGPVPLAAAGTVGCVCVCVCVCEHKHII